MSIAFLIALMGQSARAEQVQPQTRDLLADKIPDMLYCDVVVRGKVISSVVELRPQTDAMPMLSDGDPEVFVRIAIVTLQVDEVLRGVVARERLEFVAFVGASIFRDNYVPGQETVVALMWGESVLGGSYWLFSEHGRFVREPGGWMSQSGTLALDNLSVLEEALAEVAPRRLLDKADVVVVGDIEATRIATVSAPDGSHWTLMSIVLKNVSALRGGSVQPRLTVVQVLSGDYWPAWRDATPMRNEPVPDRKYCMFLKRVADGFALVGGVNGAFEVRGGHLYFEGRSRVDLTVQEVVGAGEQ